MTIGGTLNNICHNHQNQNFPFYLKEEIHGIANQYFKVFQIPIFSFAGQK